MNAISGASKVRLVRCPKCGKLLSEFPEITAYSYRCGNCNATLQAGTTGSAAGESDSRSGSLKWNSRRSDASPLDREEEEASLPRSTPSDSDQGLHEVGEERTGDGNGRWDLGERLEKGLNLGRSDAGASRSAGKPGGTFYSSNQSVASAEDTVDVDLGDARAYEASISSEEGVLSRGQSKRTFRSRNLAQTTGKEMEDEKKKKTSISVLGFAPRSGYSWDASGSIASSSRHGIGTRGRWASTDSDERLSDLNWTTSEKDRSSNSMSSGDLTENDPMELLRRMDELRDQLLKSHFQTVDGNRSGRSSMEGSRPPSSAGRAYEYQHQLRRPPALSAQSVHCCLHCRSDGCQAFSQLPPTLCCDSGLCRACSHTCCHPSTASGSRCHAETTSVLGRNYAGSHSTELGPPSAPLHGSGRETKKKRYCRPIFGGTSFVMCHECSELLQMPEDFHFSRTKRNKMRCGSCSQVIAFSLVDGTRIVPSSSSSEGSSAAGPSRRKDQVSYPDDCSQSSESYSTEGGTDPSGGRDERKRRAAALHRLMGYFSAREIMYEQ